MDGFSDVQEVIPCNFCQRRFRSEKALFCHLKVNKSKIICACEAIFNNECAIRYHEMICPLQSKKRSFPVDEVEVEDEDQTKVKDQANPAKERESSQARNNQKKLKVEKQANEPPKLSDNYRKEQADKEDQLALLLRIPSDEKVQCCPVCEQSTKDLLRHGREHGTAFLKHLLWLKAAREREAEGEV